MTDKETKLLKSKIDDEGFDYCFDGYSSWEEIKDEKFHALRKQFLESKKALYAYIFPI